MSRRGFTFVEVVVVVLIIGLLVAIAQPRILSAVQRAREAALRQDLFVLRDALDQHFADTGRYPASLAALVQNKYLRKVPADPMTGRPDTWVLVLIDEEDEAGSESGIFDVRSGSEQASVDGTPYAEW